MKEIFKFIIRRVFFIALISLVLYLSWNWFIVPTFGLKTLLGWKICGIAGVLGALLTDITKGSFFITNVISVGTSLIWGVIFFLICLILK